MICYPGSPEEPKDPDEFRLHLYTHIVQRCVETVEKYQKHLQPDQNLLKRALNSIISMFHLGNPLDITDTIATLKQTAEDLRFKLQFDLTSDTFKQADNTSNTSSKSVSPTIGFKSEVEGSLSGSIKQEYNIMRYGFIEVSDGGPNAFFLPRDIEEELVLQDLPWVALDVGLRGAPGCDTMMPAPPVIMGR